MRSGWLAEEWYHVSRKHSAGTAGCSQQVCILSFDATVYLNNAEAAVKECLDTVTIHTPLGRNIGVYRLEGSLVCHSIEAPESAQFCRSAFPAISKPLTAGRAGLAAKRPNETTYAKTYYSARLDKGVSTRFGMLFRLLPPPRKRAELNGKAEAGQRIVQNSSKPN